MIRKIVFKTDATKKMPPRINVTRTVPTNAPGDPTMPSLASVEISVPDKAIGIWGISEK